MEKFEEAERVKIPDPDTGLQRLLVHPKGQFIYRLAGRNRQKSASYYTPESLTRCLVKYALKELLPGKTADEILRLTVCEMAVGSAAFLNESIDQLAEAYLRLKQVETGLTIPHADYSREKQKVKMRLADNNVFGVDLNPIAVELAEISLWLNTIHEGAFVPWFGLQLHNGNSLIGARRQVFPTDLLKTKPETRPQRHQAQMDRSRARAGAVEKPSGDRSQRSGNRRQQSEISGQKSVFPNVGTSGRWIAPSGLWTWRYPHSWGAAPG